MAFEENEMTKSSSYIVFAILTLLLTSTLSLSINSAQAQSTTCKISGYALDSNGNGIAGASVVFNVPSIVPVVKTDSSGYYQTSGPNGTYHLNVWPPFDSNYIRYDQPSFIVDSDVTKNITLTTGYKVSGAITDSSGSPVVGACVFLSGSGSGWFSTSAGYYFVAVPAGTYTINAHPRTDSYSSAATQFPTYNEYNFVVSGNTVKNIVVGNAQPTSSPTPTPTVTQSKYKISGYITDSNGKGLANAEVIFNVPSIVPSVYSDATGYYEISAPAGTYHVNVWPPFDSNYLSYDQPQLAITSNISKNITLVTGYKVSGYISDYSGKQISGGIVFLNSYLSGWFSKSNGYYALAVPAGTYKIDVHPGKGGNGVPITSFPTYYENNFTVTGDTTKNITIGTPTTTTPTQTPTATLAPINTPTPTQQPTTTSNPNPTQQTTPRTTFNVNQAAAVQPNENSLEYTILLAVIVVISVIAIMSMVYIYRGKQAVTEATR
jgi:hypothetical protein